ncbi:MAG: adenosine deaminase [Chloroflexi bacterium]|nr:MAG: adenosine deaminase [Chloroflexota bacterium]
MGQQRSKVEPIGAPEVASRPSRELLQAMPKAELHLHLDGSLLVGTALELARTRDVDAPRDAESMRAALVAPPVGASQAALLRAFDLPIALLQDADALTRVTEELVEVKAAENVRYLEIRWGPLLHTRQGLPLAEGIEAVCAGAARAARHTGTAVRLICTAIRSHEPAQNARLAEVAAGFQDRGLTGFDLAGPEAAFPDPLPHARAFAVAREAGLHLTIHAGEWGGPAQVRRSLELAPERIAHGAVAASDDDLCRELIARNVTLDLAPTSNVQAGIVPSLADHPLTRLHRRGVSVTLSTDSLTVSDLPLTAEYERATEPGGLSLAELWAIDRRALEVAFADVDARNNLAAEFDAWAAGTGLSL